MISGPHTLKESHVKKKNGEHLFHHQKLLMILNLVSRTTAGAHEGLQRKKHVGDENHPLNDHIKVSVHSWMIHA